ncbi:unnamed protein product [Calicophoron daubneyi]|uniref:Dihydrolipoyllysine-residue succinyltransferase component of 2-oxoglutarate dehydrogenase complex, mitochondrial n=1 Tax=Calicophoron daubneyi TaxID=300641 RepID=A0AAV2TB72_CALDB
MSRSLANALKRFGCLGTLRVQPVFPLRAKIRLCPSASVLGTFRRCSFHTYCPLFAVRAVVVPAFSESVSEGDVVWKKAVGDHVNEDEVIAEIETDKTNVPVPAPCSGVIKELLVEDGGKVVSGQELFKIEEGPAPEGKAEAPKAAPSPAAEAAPQNVPKAGAVPPPAAASRPTPPSPPTPSGAPGQASRVPPPPLSQPSALVGERAEQRIKMSRMRQRIAQRLKDAQNTCAMLTTFNEVDMSNLIDLRRQYKETFEKKHGIKLGVMSTFTKASAAALRALPAVNAVIDGTDIVYRDYIDISIAVATPKGLVVPVLHNVDKMNYFEIEREIFNLGAKARAGSLALEDMDGGTFTISNSGIYGSLFGTPIINPPQSAILGLYGVFDRPVAVKGQVVIHPMMYIALSYDHRLIDGREAITFLRKVKEFVEDPRTYFLNL